MAVKRVTGGEKEFVDQGNDKYDAKQELIDRERIATAYEKKKAQAKNKIIYAEPMTINGILRLAIMLALLIAGLYLIFEIIPSLKVI